jgi:hypothetical protein
MNALTLVLKGILAGKEIPVEPYCELFYYEDYICGASKGLLVRNGRVSSAPSRDT